MKEENRKSLGFIAWLPVLVAVTLLIIELLTTSSFVTRVLYENPDTNMGKIQVISQNSSMAGHYTRLLLLPLTFALAGTFAAGRKAYRSIGVISIIAAGLQLLLALIYWYLWYYKGNNSYAMVWNIPGVGLMALFYQGAPGVYILREALCYFPTIVTLIVAFCVKDRNVEAAPQITHVEQSVYTQPVYQTVIRPEPVQPVFIPQPTPAAEPEPVVPPEPQTKPIDPQPVWQPQTEALPRFCATCGAQLPVNGLFCPKCGARRT